MQKDMYVMVSENGIGIPSTTNWTTYNEWYIFNSAVSHAESLLVNSNSTQSDVSYAVDQLNSAISTYTDSISQVKIRLFEVKNRTLKATESCLKTI